MTVRLTFPLKMFCTSLFLIILNLSHQHMPRYPYSTEPREKTVMLNQKVECGMTTSLIHSIKIYIVLQIRSCSRVSSSCNIRRIEVPWASSQSQCHICITDYFSCLVCRRPSLSLICCLLQCLLLKELLSRASGNLFHSCSQWMGLALLPPDTSHVPDIYMLSTCLEAGFQFKGGA